MPFFVIFIVIPLLELWVFLTVSRFIGLGTTLLMCFLTALIGGSMVRAQGLNALRSAQAEMMTGRSLPRNVRRAVHRRGRSFASDARVHYGFSGRSFAAAARAGDTAKKAGAFGHISCRAFFA
ncbi:MAG: FxsA family protein [Alphaproteobacteria bacterium]|nr:FxsA family protein [Alphaproteobacteria bacterium]